MTIGTQVSIVGLILDGLVESLQIDLAMISFGAGEESNHLVQVETFILGAHQSGSTFQHGQAGFLAVGQGQGGSILTADRINDHLHGLPFAFVEQRAHHLSQGTSAGIRPVLILDRNQSDGPLGGQGENGG